jgi:polysaccharide export outer membrane protein
MHYPLRKTLVRIGSSPLFKLGVLVLVLSLCTASLAAQEGPIKEPVQDYVIGPQDVLEIVVWDNEDLSGKTAVTLDGYINYQLIGKLKAAELSPPELAGKITKLLADGYLIDPQVTVRVLEYRSKKVFIVGEAMEPGTYYLRKKTTLVETVSMAGGPTKEADREVIVVRPYTNVPEIDQGTENLGSQGKQIRVDLRSALEGDLSQNIFVENGDSIFIPKAKTFFIMGEVRKPGEYKLERGTTVRKAVSLAGGASEKAALGRIKVVRIIDGKDVESRIGIDELLLPNDTVTVPESIF